MREHNNFATILTLFFILGNLLTIRVFENKKFKGKFTETELISNYIQLVSLLLPAPSRRQTFDRFIKICINESKGNESVSQLKEIVSDFILNQSS
jgi:hypothetical protein